MNRDSQNQDRSGDDPETKTEALLTEYSELREEIRLLMELQHSRALGGTAALGAVIGYSLLSKDGLVFIVLVPIIIAFLFILTVQTTNGMMFLGRHIYDIESELDIDSMGWEHRYGGVILNERAMSSELFSGLDWSGVPELVIYILVAMIYAGFIIISMIVIQDYNLPEPLSGLEIHLIGSAYLVITILALVSAYSHTIVKGEIQPDRDITPNELNSKEE